MFWEISVFFVFYFSKFWDFPDIFVFDILCFSGKFWDSQWFLLRGTLRNFGVFREISRFFAFTFCEISWFAFRDFWEIFGIFSNNFVVLCDLSLGDFWGLLARRLGTFSVNIEILRVSRSEFLSGTFGIYCDLCFRGFRDLLKFFGEILGLFVIYVCFGGFRWLVGTFDAFRKISRYFVLNFTEGVRDLWDFFGKFRNSSCLTFSNFSGTVRSFTSFSFLTFRDLFGQGLKIFGDFYWKFWDALFFIRFSGFSGDFKEPLMLFGKFQSYSYLTIRDYWNFFR